MASIAQIRAARGLLGWSQKQLAEAVGMNRVTIARAETVGVSDDGVAAIRRGLEKAGVIFVEENGDGPGVRLRKGKQ